MHTFTRVAGEGAFEHYGDSNDQAENQHKSTIWTIIYHLCPIDLLGPKDLATSPSCDWLRSGFTLGDLLFLALGVSDLLVGHMVPSSTKTLCRLAAELEQEMIGGSPWVSQRLAMLVFQVDSMNV